MTDSATATSRGSRSPAPIVWFRLLLTPATRDWFVTGLAAPMTSDILREVEGGAAAVATDTPCDADGSGSPHSCPQKNEKLGMEATGGGRNAAPPLGSLAWPNENPDIQQDGAESATNAEKDDLQAKVGEHASSSVMPWQETGPPVLKLTSLLRVASGVEKEHEPRSSLLRPIPWQWLQESCDWSACSRIHKCSA